MKRTISFFLSLIMVMGIFLSMPFTKIDANAITGSELFTVKTSGMENNKITYTVYLNAGVNLRGAIVYAKFDAEYLALDKANSGAYMVDDGDGGERENIGGMYEVGFMAGYSNQFSIAHVYGQDVDYKVGSSDKPYIQFTFNSVNEICPETFVEFYCYEFISKTTPDNTIANGSNILIASVSNIHIHSYGKWIVENEATCTGSGRKYKVCSSCDENFYEDFPAIGHDFNDSKCVNCGVDINIAFVDMLKFTLTPSGDSYSVKASNKEISGDLVIPKTYNGLPVTSIDYLGFQNCSELTSVIIPESVTNIGGCSFISCTNLKTIILPDSVEYIGENVFYDTAFYNDETNWENGVLYIRNHLVEADCNVVSGEYAIKNGTITVASYALYGCNKLTTLVLPNSLKNIDYEALLACKELSRIEVSENNDNFVCIDGVLYNGDCTEIVWYSLKNTQSDFEIVDTLKSLDFWVFYENNYLDKIIVSFNSQLSSISYSNDEVNQYELEYGCNKKALFSDIRVKNKTIVHDISTEWTIDKKATCTQEGEKSHHCNYCDVLTDETVIPELGHKNGDWVVEKEPTCTMNGIKMQHCVNCDEILNVEMILSKGHTPSDWIIKKATVNSAGKKYKECTECGEILETAKIAQLKAGKPKLKSIENTEYGVLTKWSKVSGADKYRVYRKTSKSDWECIATTSNTYYTDKTAKSGTKYYYAVKSRNEAGNSSLSGSLSKYYLADNTLKTPKSTKSGITLKWTKVTGAQGYIIYRKTGSGSYSKLKTEKGVSNLSYTDKSAKKGKTYTYKIKAYYSKTYSAYSNAKKIKDKY